MESIPQPAVPVPLQEGVERLAIHARLARRGADVAVAAGQHGLGVGELETRQVLLPRLFPRKAGELARPRRRLQVSAMSSGSRTPPGCSAVSFSITFLSCRTLPGQGCLRSAS